MSAEKKIMLKSSDEELFEVDEAVAMESQTIKHMVEDNCAGSVIPVPNVKGNILAKVIEYMKKHFEAANSKAGDDQKPSDDVDIESWDADFVKVENAILFELILAANYLDIKKLLALASQAVAGVIKDMSVEEARIFFGIQNDFTPEEEEKIRQDVHWAFQ